MKPSLVIPFKSDSCSLKIKGFKNNLKTSDLFNVTFKTEGRLIEIIRKVRDSSVKPYCSTDTSLPTIIDHNGRDMSYNVDGTVYMASCISCKKVGKDICYIGESGRCLSTRLKEHLKHVNNNSTPENCSPVGMHQFNEHGSQPSIENWNLKILCRSSRTQNRRALEAFMIRKYKPTLNRDSGVYIII